MSFVRNLEELSFSFKLKLTAFQLIPVFLLYKSCVSALTIETNTSLLLVKVDSVDSADTKEES